MHPVAVLPTMLHCPMARASNVVSEHALWYKTSPDRPRKLTVVRSGELGRTLNSLERSSELLFLSLIYYTLSYYNIIFVHLRAMPGRACTIPNL